MWGRQPSGEGAPTHDFAKCSQKLHEIERIWIPRGGARPKFYYVDLSLHVVLNNGGTGFKPQPIFAKLGNKFKKMFQIRKSRIFLVLKLGK